MPAPRTLESVHSGGVAPSTRRPAIFLDRDGTIVVERYYLADPDRAELVPDAAAALGALSDAGYALIVITNQSGIARGLYRVEDFLAVQRRVDALLEAEGVVLDAVYYCPHHPDFTGPCECRKPGTALFHLAAAELGIRLDQSVLVGDRMKDVEPARALGARGVLVRTGYGAEHEHHAPPDVVVVDTLADAAVHVLGAVQVVEAKRRNRVDTPDTGR